MNWAMALQGRTAGPLSLSDAAFDDDALLAGYARRHLLPHASSTPHSCTCACCMDEHAAAVEAEPARAGGHARRHRCGRCCSISGAASRLPERGRICREDRASRRARDLRPRPAALDELAASCPENFRCFALTVAAEMKRLDGDLDAAVALYETSLAYARETDNLQQRGAGERAVRRAWLSRGDRRRGRAVPARGARRVSGVGSPDQGGSARRAVRVARPAGAIEPVVRRSARDGRGAGRLVDRHGDRPEDGAGDRGRDRARRAAAQADDHRPRERRRRARRCSSRIAMACWRSKRKPPRAPEPVRVRQSIPWEAGRHPVRTA